MLHDVDGKEYDLARSRVDLAEDAAKRPREAVIDVDLIDLGQVEILLDHLRGDLGRKFWIADHLRQPDAP
jgi:hypothetical protein